jgi:hypothetical protein
MVRNRTKVRIITGISVAPTERRTTAMVRHVDTKKSRAVVLMEMLIRDGVFGEEILARELVVRTETLTRYREGKIPVPHDRQLCLALLMTQLPGRYARLGYGLLEQVKAASSYEARRPETETWPTAKP